MENKLSTIPEALEDLKAGKMLIVVDNPNRENQGDIIFPAQFATTESINFLLNECRGMVCVALSKEEATRLELPLMVPPIHATEKTGVQFTVTVDSIDVTAYGISSSDRAKTIQTLGSRTSIASDLVRPGHIFPLLARDGGVLERQGHTEATVDLCRLAGFAPVGVLCEVLGTDGEPLRLPALVEFGKKHNLKVISVDDLRSHLEKNPLPTISSKSVVRTAEAMLPTEYGVYKIFVYKSVIDNREHVALVFGNPAEPALVRAHSECLTGDTFGSRTCDCGPQLHKSMEMIREKGSGVILYLNQEGRGIGLTNKIKAYALQQEKGMDTVEANIALGFSADERNFKIAAEMLCDIGIRKIALLSNNPDKLSSLGGYGIEVVEHVPLETDPNETNRDYLKVKKNKLGHDLKLV
ncbi:MAG: GTP cyclohydrolase II [Candidatus Pacebacteria bacterium]|nr:GTP cyclohydrolase II [Candidatus Paceibacterota bacterium]